MELSNKEKVTIDAYEAIENARDISGYYMSDFWQEYFDKLQKLLPQGKILDIGCGNGKDASLFINNGYQYIGIDLSPAVIQKAQTKIKGGEFRVMSIYELDFPDNTFDGFWSGVALLHIPKNKVDTPLQEIKRVVKLGGFGFISMQRGEKEKMIPSPDAPGRERFFAFYAKDEFKKVLEDNGFEVLESDAPKDVSGKNPKSGDGWLTYFVRILK